MDISFSRKDFSALYYTMPLKSSKVEIE